MKSLQYCKDRAASAIKAAVGLVLLLAFAACSTSSDDDEGQTTPVAVTGVTLDAATAAVNIGTSRLLTATVAPSDAANKAVTWTSSDPSVATVSSSGLVTSAALGTTTVTVTTADGGKTASCAVTVREPDVYVGGSYDDGICHPGYWTNGTWNNLTPTNAGTTAEVNAICLQDGVLYAGGYSTDASGYTEPGYWKNGTWNALPRVTATTDGYVYAIAVSGSDVHAAGTVQDTTGSYYLGAYWKNGVLATYAHGTYDNTVNDMAVNGSDVYVAGSYNNGSIEVGGYWKNGAWIELSPLNAGESSPANTIAFLGSDIVLGGKGDPNPGEAVKWTNGTISALDTARPYESWVYDSAVSEGSLYLSGAYNDVDDSPDLGEIPCYWKDGVLVLLSKPDVDGLRTGGIQSRSWIAVSGTLVYMAGAIRDDNNGGSNPYAWRDGVRTQLETQSGHLYHYVYGIALD